MPTVLRPPPAPAAPVAAANQPSIAAPVAGVALGAAGLLAAGMTPAPGTVYAASAGLVGISAVAGVGRARAKARAQTMATVQSALAGLIGRGPESSAVGRRWAGGWVGTPRRITITYDPAAPSTNPEWANKIREALAARLGVEYLLDRHQPRKCRMVLRARADRAEKAPDAFLALRAGEIIKHLFGADSTSKLEWDTTDLVAIDVTHKAGVRISPNPIVRIRIERTLSTMLPGRWRAHWDLQEDTVRFELRPEIPASLQRNLDPPCGADVDRLPYAVDEDGTVLFWDLRSSAATPHFLIAGSTGTGKTVTIRGLVLEACRREWQVRICDPKRVEFVGLKAWPNVEVVATAVADIVAVIHQTWLEMERRYQLIEAGEAVTEDFPRLLLVLDEYRYFFGIVNGWYAGVKGVGGAKLCPVLEEVFLIASLGRTARVHLIVGSQRPDASWLGGDLRDQFMARASLGRLSPDGAKMMWDAHHIGVSVPRGKPGRGTSVNEAGEPVECQSYWIPDPTTASSDEQPVLDALRPSSATYERYVVVPPASHDEDGNELPDRGRYGDYLAAAYEPARLHPDLAAATSRPARPPVMVLDDLEPRSAAQSVEDSVDRDYEAPHSIGATALEPGYLVCVDEPTDTWGVVETVEEDLVDSGQVCICWRSDQEGEDYGVLVVDTDAALSVRSPRDPNERN